MARATTTRMARAFRATLLRSAPLRTTSHLPRLAIRQTSRRGYADLPPPNSNASKAGFNKTMFFGICLATATSIGGFVVYQRTRTPAFTPENVKEVVKSSVEKPEGGKPGFEDYQAVYNHVAGLLHEKDDYDDGSYGPVLLRLGWHCSGTFDAQTKTGGSNGATMRFMPEGDHGANAGLKAARDFLEPVKEKFPWITYSDLWTLASVCSIQELQGPVIPWRPGRADRDIGFCTPDGRLPDGSKDQTHLRAIFGRMGFDDRETVALSGAHALGRCHTDRSGFSGPWSFSPTVVTNDYYKLLLNEAWEHKKWDGPLQFEDVKTKSLMMLPTDMALVKDKGFRPFVEEYAQSNEKFFEDFSNVLCKLFELGVPFKTGEETRMRFKVTE